MNSEDFKKRKAEINHGFDEIFDEFQKSKDEIQRIHTIAENTNQILDDLDEQFCGQTGLTKTDMAFLFLALGLQVARQYLLTNNTGRLTAPQGDQLIHNILPRDYREILTQSVPYDAVKTGSHVFDTGLSGNTHRYRTLGHDPIFGWVFGTANILTNSLTKTNFETYQVSNMMIIRHYPMGVVGMLNQAVQYSIEDPKRLVAAVIRQAVHLGSDFFTKQGLPIPGVAIANNTLAQKMLINWHIDMWSITRGATLSAFINCIITAIHRLFFKGESVTDQKLYEVRTKKIISYSNLIASSSNIAVTAITRDFNKLDIGGIAVSIYRLITDAKFIRQVKEDFIFVSYKKMILENDF